MADQGKGARASSDNECINRTLYVDDYPPRYGGADPSYGGTPKATPMRGPSTPVWASTDSAIEAPQMSASLIFKSALSSIAGGVLNKANTSTGGGGGGGHLSDAEVELQHHYNAYFDDSNANANASPPHIPFSLAGGPIQMPEYDAYTDVEGARPVEEEHEGFIESTHIGKHVKPPFRIDLKFVAVKYKIILQKEAKWRGQTASEKEILHNITGYVASGEMLAMMGPSGSGKTTFLNLLGGRKSNSINITRSILYNGFPYTKNLKRRMGFVTQDDVLYAHLSVRETLRFAAMLRLGRGLRREEKVDRAEEVIVQLGLQRCADTLIGNQFLRGVSGGERKRVSIGQEILIDPSLLFLDEPTSGLDSTTALRLIKLLQQLSHEGRTVVTTIHQPSSRAFHMFDKLLLLSEGHGVYFGKARGAMTYFDSIGFSPSIPMNPADFLLDLCSGNTTDISLPRALKLSTTNSSKNTRFLTKDSSNVPLTPSSYLAKDVKKYLVECYENQIIISEKEATVEKGDVHVEGGEVENQLIIGEKEAMVKKGDVHVEGAKVAMMSKGEAISDMRVWETTWWEQFVILLVRGFKERRHEYLNVLRIVQVVASAFLTGSLWWRSKHSTPLQLQDQMGLIFFMCVFWGYLPLFSCIFTFPLEKAMLAKESASNMYRLSAYFMARTLGDLPLDLAHPCVFMVILYFMADLRQTISAFLYTLLTIFLLVITSQSFGLLIGAALMDVQNATTFASITTLAFMLAGGFFVKSIPPFISWIKLLSFQGYTYDILLKIQYENDYSYNCQSHGGCQSTTSAPILHNISLHGAAKSIIAILIMMFGYRFLAYIALRCMRTIT